MTKNGNYFVAVVGGAISGSVAAEILADHGIRVAVFEQNTRPYGKIEDGLPRWHVEQRKQEYARIDARMKKPERVFHPVHASSAAISNLHELLRSWGFSAVILANGAWRDRELGVPEAEQYVGQRPRLPESFYLLVQPQERKGLHRTALRNARRSRGGRRRTGVH